MTGTPLPGKTQWETDQYLADGGMHARLAQSLIEAAHFIRTHPDLPIPHSVEVHYCIPAGTDQAGEDELHRIAGMLSAKVTGEAVSETHHDFGPVSYRATYITKHHMSAYRAHMAPYYAAQRLEDMHVAVAEVHAEIYPARVA
jgi:hypothetical protein